VRFNELMASCTTKTAYDYLGQELTNIIVTASVRRAGFRGTRTNGRGKDAFGSMCPSSAVAWRTPNNFHVWFKYTHRARHPVASSGLIDILNRQQAESVRTAPKNPNREEYTRATSGRKPPTRRWPMMSSQTHNCNSVMSSATAVSGTTAIADKPHAKWPPSNGPSSEPYEAGVDPKLLVESLMSETRQRRRRTPRPTSFESRFLWRNRAKPR